MELSKELKQAVGIINGIDKHEYGPIANHSAMLILEALSNLCDGAGETQWSIKDQIQIAIEELNN